ncbi:TATA-box-binding protein [Halogeometricum limi]|uniref:TATA-box-binding protein n=1 Tax=Halogeometricum limi TaxID=555875 RepID=A0A1I6HG78_9EURY|nr:TATA-box-binding protein [Halogeometricum limi]SFR53515.1 TATA binding protein of transcription factor TFIID [Halogeometricum limi]
MNLEVVNAVGSGDLGIEIDLNRLATDVKEVEFDPDKYPGAYVRLEGVEPLITVYRTGKYIITGSKSDEEAYSCRKQFLKLLTDEGVLGEPEDEWFSMQNYVCTGELDQVQNLNALAIGLGLEYTEYEPEQFPGLVFRPDDTPVVILIFSSGKVVVTGAKDIDMAEEAFQSLKEDLDALV